MDVVTSLLVEIRKWRKTIPVVIRRDHKPRYSGSVSYVCGGGRRIPVRRLFHRYTWGLMEAWATRELVGVED